MAQRASRIVELGASSTPVAPPPTMAISHMRRPLSGSSVIRARHAEAVVEQPVAESVGPARSSRNRQFSARPGCRSRWSRSRPRGRDSRSGSCAVRSARCRPRRATARSTCAALAVDACQRAEEEAIAPAVAVAAVADLVEIGVERSGRDLVQQRLPDVGAVALDEDDVVALATIFRAELAASSSPPAPPPTMTIWVLRAAVGAVAGLFFECTVRDCSFEASSSRSSFPRAFDVSGQAYQRHPVRIRSRASDADTIKV